MILFLLATLALGAFGVIVAALLALPSRSAMVIAALTISLISLTLVVQGTLLLGVFTRPAVTGVFLGLPFLAAAVALRRPARERVLASVALFGSSGDAGGTRGERQPVLSVIAGVSLVLVIAVYVERVWVDLRIPPLDWDSNNYHLVSAARWVMTGRWGAPLIGLRPPHAPPSLAWVDSYPHQSELIDAWLALFTHSLQLTTLLQIPFAALMVVATYGLCRLAACRRPVAVIAASMVGLVPLTLAQVTTSYNDVVRAATLVAGWYFLVAALSELGRPRRGVLLFLSGAALGFSAAVKASSGPALVAAFLVVVAAVVAEHRAAGPRDEQHARAGSIAALAPRLLAFALPAVLLGGFWYIRTWSRWGSPFWPIRVGPFGGTVDLSGMSGGQQTLLANLGEMVRGWGGGISAMSHGVTFDAQRGALGPAWLLILAPAVLVASVLWRRHRRALITIVYPILLLDLYDGTRIQPRYVLAITVAGAVAFALVVEASSRTSKTSRTSSRREGRSGLGLIAPTLAVLGLLLAGFGAAAAVLRPNWAAAPGGGFVPPAHYWTGVDSYFQYLTAPARVRRDGDFWRDSNRIEAQIPEGAAIGLSPDAPPQLLAPWIGRDLVHALVVLPATSSSDQLAQQMKSQGLRFLVIANGTLSAQLAGDREHRFQRLLPQAACLDYNTCGLTSVWRLIG